MNGFRAELLGRVLGVNGHATVVSGPAGIPNFDGLVDKLQGAPGLVGVMPYVEGQVMASANGVASGALVRGVRPADLAGPRRVREPCHRRVAGGAGNARHGRHRQPDGAADGIAPRQPDHADLAQGCRHGTGQRAADQVVHRGRGVRGRDVRVRQQLRLHPARRRAGLLPAAGAGQRGRDPGRGSRADRQLSPRAAVPAGRRAAAGRLAAAELALLRRACRSSGT